MGKTLFRRLVFLSGFAGIIWFLVNSFLPTEEQKATALKQEFQYISYVPEGLIAPLEGAPTGEVPLLTRDRIIAASTELIGHVNSLQPQTPFEMKFAALFLGDNPLRLRPSPLLEPSPLLKGIEEVNNREIEWSEWIGDVKAVGDCRGRRIWYQPAEEEPYSDTPVVSKRFFNPHGEPFVYHDLRYHGASVYFCPSARMSEEVLLTVVYGMLYHFIPSDMKKLDYYLQQVRVCKENFWEIELFVLIYRWEAMIRMMKELRPRMKAFSQEDVVFVQQLREAQESLLPQNYRPLPPPPEYQQVNGTKPRPTWWFAERCDQLNKFDHPQQ